MDKQFFFFMFLVPFITRVHAQDQSGFMMIDCGLPDNTRYTDSKTSINYVSDGEYIDTGVIQTISPEYNNNPDLEQQFFKLRAFPEGVKNCYTLIPPYVRGKAKYFVRASFLYGNYDNLKKPPKFNIYLGVNYWGRVDGSLDELRMEILHTPTLNYTFVCLVNTGHGTPFISALELRLVDDNIYQTESFGSMILAHRLDLQSINNFHSIRYKDDIYDRIWNHRNLGNEEGVDVELNTTVEISSSQNIFNVPSIVMKTALSPANASRPLEGFYSPDDPTADHFMAFHFADFQSQYLREFDILINGEPYLKRNFTPNYLSTTTISGVLPDIARTTIVNVSFVKTSRSILPPLLNAVEIYQMIEFPNLFTDRGDVDAMKDVKATYRVKRNWQGDPCNPRVHLWDGLDCFNASVIDPPRIISLTLTSSELTGEISHSIFNLKMLRRLDLSFNNLTGKVPEFLAQMSKLTFINLSGNNLSGTVPLKLLERAEIGSLELSMEGNPYLCTKKTCALEKRKNKKMLSIIISLAAGLTVVLIIVIFIWIYIIRRRRSRQQDVFAESNDRGTTLFKAKNQNFSYSDVLKITKNLQTVLGSGGFGKVYHGILEGNQVAVKIISPSSVQGYKQFKAEAELLLRVHHRNLTSLVGYCHESNKLGLIYEFMANGDLKSQLSERSRNFLSWESRLDIALDAAQGLEYMHNGCKPPIIHRDVKSTNILLDDKFHAKLGDFGLSRAFSTEGTSNLSTTFAGTLGYLDPEFNMNEKSDVFSFGVVLLELITGQPAISRSEEKMHISEWVSDILITKGDVGNVVDPRIGGREYDINSMGKAVDLAMECVSVTSISRPSMDIVVTELKRCLAMERTRIKTGYISESIQDSSEINSLNIESSEMNSYNR